METLININCHTLIEKSYVLFLDAKMPPDLVFHKQSGSYRLLTSCGSGMTGPWLCVHIGLKVMQSGV